MTQIFTGTGLGTQGSSLGQLGGYGPKSSASLGSGGESVYVNGANGNLVLKHSDGFLADLGMGMDLFQTYNSRGEGANPWRFNLETRLTFEGTPNTEGSVVKRVDEDGHISRFIYDAGQKTYMAEDGSISKVTYYKGDWQYQEGTGTTRSNYNSNGQLTSLCDKDGHLLNLSYENGQLSRITDNSGKQSITWTFTQGMLRDVTFVSEDKIVHHLHYEYDAQNRLSKVSRKIGDGQTYWISYGYVQDSNLISDINQSDGTSLHIDYDKDGRVKRLVDGEGRISTYEYFEGKTIVTNGLGESWTYFYDKEARLTGIDGPENYHARYYYEGKHLKTVTEGKQRWSFTYNDAGDCIRIDSPSGEVVQRTYDTEHRIVTETNYQIFDGEHHPRKPQTARYVYDEQGHLRFEIKADGTVTEHRYNNEGLRISTRCYLRAHLNTKELDDNQALSIEELMLWTQQQNAQAVSLTSYGYDWRGNLLEEIHYTLIDENGAGILTKDSLQTYSLYDAAGRLIEQSSITEKGRVSTHYIYDALGRLIKTVDNQQHEVSIEYDDTHHRVIKTDANGLKTISTYDASGLLLCVQRLDKAHDYGCTSYRYDAASRLIAETDVSGKTNYFFYDAQGRLSAKVTASGQVIEYQYDDEGHCIKTHQYEKHLDTRGYKDKLPDWSLIKPEASSTDRISQVVYNQYHQIAYQINAEGAVIEYKYDAQGRVIAKTAYSNRLNNFSSFSRLNYSDVVLQQSNKDRTISYYYDTEGRLEGEINGEGAATGYRYDAEGHLIEKRHYSSYAQLPLTNDWHLDVPTPLNKDIRTFSLYNAAGLKIADIDAEGYLTEYRYDSRGLLTETYAYYTKRTPPITPDESTTIEALRPQSDKNDHYTRYYYNDLNQLIEERTQGGLITSYSYNEIGLILTKTISENKTHEARQQRYRYDVLGRVIQTLDALGSALLDQGGPLSLDEIETIWQQHGIRYVYDKAGRLLTKTNALNQTTRYYYNDEGLLIYTIGAEGSITEMRYNAFSQLDTTIRYHAYWKGQAEVTIEQLKRHIDSLADERFDEVTHYEYNVLGLVSSKSQGSKSNMKTTYNAFGELEQSIQRISSTRETITAYEYDRRGLLRLQTEDLGGINKTHTTQYDVFGRMKASLDGRTGKTNYWLNKRGEVIRIDNPGYGKKEMSYDAFGRILIVEDKTLNSYTYNDQNNTLTVSRAVDSVTSKLITEFNAFGDKIKYTDGNQNTTIFHYDEKGQLTQIEGPEHNRTKYRYDDEGCLVLEEKANGLMNRYTYDAEGHVLTKTTDPDGLNIKTTYSYDGVGRQLSIIEAGRYTQFIYDNQGNLIKKCVDPQGLNLITEFTYTESGRLDQQITFNTNGSKKVIAYEWDKLGRCVLTTIDPNGLSLTTRYEYDNNDNLICQIDAKQHKTQYLYDAHNLLSYRIDARGVVTQHVYSATGSEIRTITYANRISSVTRYNEATLLEAIRPDSNVDQYQFFTFDKQNRLTRSYDSLGYATEYTYDANDNVVVKKLYDTPCSLNDLKNGKLPQPNDSGLSRITRFAYDGLNQERFQIDTSGRVTEYCYDTAGQVMRQTRLANPLSLNQMNGDFSVSHIKSLLRLDTVKDQSTYYSFDAAGRLIAQANPNGGVTGYKYDEAGNLIATTRYATDLASSVLANENWSTQLQKNSNDRTTRAVYDAAGREVYKISATGKVLSRQYDDVGNIISERVYAKPYNLSTYSLEELNEATCNNNSRDQLTTYDYDAVGRLQSKTDALQHTTSYTYDKNNNVETKTDAKSSVWTYSYDECNQLIESSSPKMNVSTYKNGKLVEERRSIITKNTYDSFGNLIATIRDAEGIKQTTEYTYDTNNRKLTTVYPDVMVNHASHNSSTERQEVRQTLSEKITYNAFGEVIEHSDKSGHSRRWVYDLNGCMQFSMDAKNALTKYEYDTFDNLQKKTLFSTQLTLPEGSDYSSEVIENAHQINHHDRHEFYSYDKEGRLIETRKDALISYDARKGEYFNLSPTTKITYNVFGEIAQTSVQLSDTRWSITNTYYNLEGLKAAQVDAEGYLTTYEYDDFCHLSKETQYAERCTERALEGYKEPQNNAKDRIATFDYDAIGQLTSKTIKNATYQQLTGKGSQYKNSTSDLTSSYRYDSLGNLVSTTDPQGHTVYSYYNETGQLTAKVGAITQAGRSATTYRYDALGNLLETHQWATGVSEADETHFNLKGESTKDIITSDVYDIEGHLMQQTDGTGHQVNYSYDANGNISRSWQVLHGKGKSTLIQDKRYTFDAENHLIQSATIKANGVYATDDAQYNAFGEVIAKGINGALTTHIDYDVAGRVWRSNLHGYYQIYVYDLSDHVTQVVTSTNAFGIEHDEMGVDLSQSKYETAISYDKQEWFYDLQRQDNIYDDLGRLLSQSKDGSTSISDRKNKKVNKRATQSNELDRWGNVTKHTNANNISTLYEYNVFNQVTKQTLPHVRVVDEHGVAQTLAPEQYYAYDALGHVIAMTDANGHTVAKILDAEGRTTQEIDALGNHRDKNYDLLGQLTSTVTKRGSTTTTINYTYDKANRLLSVGTTNTMHYYVYDEAGQLIKQTDGLHNATYFEYDELGHQVTREKGGHLTKITFDDAGHKTSEIDAKLNTQSWVYDENGRVKEHIDLGKHKTVYTYNKNGLVLTEQSTNGKNKAYHYYSDGQLEQYVDNGREVVDFTYDAEGNVLSKESSSAGSWILETDHYVYDALGRLVQVRRRNPDDTDKRHPDEDKALLSIDYEYDAVGNIRDTKVMARYADHQRVTQNNYYRYDENNRMTLSKGQLVNGKIVMTTSQGSELGYDETGNMSKARKYEDGQLHDYTYRYNSDNLLDMIQKDGHNLQTKEYDAAGNVLKEHLYNNQGNATQHNLMHYEGGLLQSVVTNDKDNKEVSVTHYEYDKVDNLETLTTAVRAQGNSAGYTQTHKYSYAKWDSYQQELDSATLEVNGSTRTSGSNTRVYDVNGQIKEALDSKTDGYGNVQTTSTRYYTSSLDGIRSRIDKEGQTAYLTVAGKTIGDLRLDDKGASHLEVYGGFTPSGTPAQENTMLPSLWQKGSGLANTLKDAFQKISTENEGVLPEVPQDSLGTYNLQLGDTLERIALQVYGDSSLWYLIADANGITDKNERAGEKGSQLHVGQRLNIPPAASSQHHTNATHKVMSGSDWLGNISATTPFPPAPPAPKRRNSPWRILGMIAVAVIATVATVLSAGAVGAALGASGGATGLGGLLSLGTTVLGGGGGAMIGGSAILGSIGAGFAAGFIGSIAGQGAAAALHLQNGIDLKGALITGLASAATAGVANTLGGNATYQKLISAMDDHSAKAFSIHAAADMMERDIVSQGINVGARKHQHLDWLELGISTATAGFIGSTTGKSLNEGLEKTFKKAAPTISSELQALVSGAATAAATGNNFNATQVLTENLGSAVANNVVQAGSTMGLEEAKESAVEAAKNAMAKGDKQKALAELMQSKANVKAEQSRGAWRDDTVDDLSFSSDLFKPWEKSGNEVSFENKISWNSNHGDNEFINRPKTVIEELALPDTVSNLYKLFQSEINNGLSLDNVSPKIRYIAELYPYAYEASEKTGLSLELMLAQGAQETGWGAGVLPGTNNMFNIKKGRDWLGPVEIVKGALEYKKDGTKYFERSEFRIYANIKESVQDRIDFLTNNKRYAALFKQDVKGNTIKEAFVLQKAHYAGHNPNYADSLIKVANGPTMRRALEFARSYYGY